MRQLEAIPDPRGHKPTTGIELQKSTFTKILVRPLPTVDLTHDNLSTAHVNGDDHTAIDAPKVAQNQSFVQWKRPTLFAVSCCVQAMGTFASPVGEEPSIVARRIRFITRSCRSGSRTHVCHSIINRQMTLKDKTCWTRYSVTEAGRISECFLMASENLSVFMFREN